MMPTVTYTATLAAIAQTITAVALVAPGLTHDLIVITMLITFMPPNNITLLPLMQSTKENIPG